MPRRNSRAEGPHEIDVHVGKVVAERRKYLGLTQADLGKVIGVTFQQVQKYERGSNRMSASILFEIAQTLEIHPRLLSEDWSVGAHTRLTADFAGVLGDRTPRPALADQREEDRARDHSGAPPGGR
jgi:Predicted transcriptional regulators